MLGRTIIGKLPSRRTSRILLAVLSLLVLALSLVPRPEVILGGFSAYDKVEHFVAYLVLGFLAMHALDRRGKLPSLLLAAVGCSVFGGIIEVVQPLVGRSMELADLLADVAGSTAGAGAVALLTRKLGDG